MPEQAEDKRDGAGAAAAGQGPSIAIVTSIAYSLPNFRGALIAALIERGLRVYALAPDYDDKTRAAVLKLGAEPVDFPLERTGMRPLRDLRDMFRLAALFRRLRPDVVFCYFIKPVIYGSLAARRARVPRRYAMIAGLGYVYTAGVGKMGWRRRLLRGMVSRLYRFALARCSKVFFQNQDDLGQFAAAGLIEPDKAILLKGSGVDLAHFAPAQPVPSPVVFLLMARLLREKGIGEYVEAARLVRASPAGAAARFVLLGGRDPNPGGFTQAEVDAWTAEGVIEWHDHVDDVRPWIAASSVYVLPSYREGKPRSTQEAMAMARPVITTDVPGCRDTVEEGVNGFLVPPRDAAALAAAMQRFIADPALVVTMGRESRRLAAAHFDVHVINGTILRAMDVA